MAVGDFLTLAVAAIIVFLGGRAVARQTWNAWFKPLVSKVWPAKPQNVMSHSRLSAPSEPSVFETDAPKAEPVVVVAPVPKPATVDTCKSLRGHGYSRDEAREFLRGLGFSLDNNTWAKAAPPPEDTDLMVNPWSGRQTRKSYYPDAPDLEYKELEA